MVSEAMTLDGPPSEQARSWLAGALGVPDPFPWQMALLQRMLAGSMPAAVDVPTGLGKTAVIAIWLVARALGAPVPTRLVYVVDRRAVVDQATTVAESLREFVAAMPILSAALGLDAPLAISTLRGQFADNRAWLVDPGAPAIVLGTVDMVGSRLLFEGYGVTRRMRPYHAGLLGIDCLLVLDEAHLVPPFERLVRAVADMTRRPESGALRSLVPRAGLQVLALSATSRAPAGLFGLSSEDHAHPVVARRLSATKHLRIREAVAAKQLAEHLAAEASNIGQGDGLRCIVFCNRRDDAQKVHDLLLKSSTAMHGPVEVELFVGGRRVHERQAASRWLSERGFMAGSSAVPACRTYVVATSAGEVGIDLDADHMVADLVAWERMVQRLGRVNRRGERAADIVVVPAIAEEEPETKRLAAVVEVLHALPQAVDARDASPGALSDLRRRSANDAALAQRIAAASTPEPLCPPLSLPLVEAWALTSIEQHPGRPEIAPWLRGWIDEEEPQTTLVWRRHLPVDARGQLLQPREYEAYAEAASPHLTERLEVETWRAIDLLEARARRVVDRTADSETDAAAAKLSVRDVGAVVMGDAPVAVKVSSLLSKPAKREQEARHRQFAGAVVLVDVRMGGLRNGLLDADSDEATDVTEDESAVLPFRLSRVKLDGMDEPRGGDEASWRAEVRVPVRRSSEGDDVEWLVIESRRSDSPESEEGRSVGRAQLLAEHQAWAERAARALAQRLRLASEYEDMLAVAARLHDEGKRAERWQRAFGAPSDGEPLGKSRGRPNLGILGGYRHELGSLARAESHADLGRVQESLRDLCLHLIAAHHGHARPTIRLDGADSPPSVLARRAGEIALRFSRLQQQWGPWGLAWWEALLRAADQKASRENDALETEVRRG
jgi:CRISPR-associated endonuclease/helicase Cas3